MLFDSKEKIYITQLCFEAKQINIHVLGIKKTQKLQRNKNTFK